MLLYNKPSGYSMPVFRKYYLSSSGVDTPMKITVTGVGIRRYWPFKQIIPYLSYADIKVNLTRNHNIPKLAYTWTLYRFDEKQKSVVNKGNGEFSPTQKKTQLNLGYLKLDGIHSLELWCGQDTPTSQKQELVGSFTLIDRDVFLFKVGYAILGMIIGIAGSLIYNAVVNHLKN